jgi:hypothetical protein
MEKYKTRAMTVILRPDDIVELVDNQDWTGADTVEVMEEVSSMVTKVIDNEPRGLLISAPARHYSKEVMNHANAVEMGDVARAILLTSFGAKVMGSLYIKLLGTKPNRTGRIVPIKLFTDKEAAVKWLLEEMEKSKK